MSPAKDIQNQIDTLCNLVSAKVYDGRMKQIRAGLLELQRSYAEFVERPRRRLWRKVKGWISIGPKARNIG
jgi:hypothetical protein